MQRQDYIYCDSCEVKFENLRSDKMSCRPYILFTHDLDPEFIYPKHTKKSTPIYQGTFIRVISRALFLIVPGQKCPTTRATAQ